MIEHIVKYNETVNDILDNYHIDLSELKANNSHITDFSRLLSGSKLMIPVVSREVEQVLEKTEGFVMDYYPKISDEIIPAIEPKESRVENVEPMKARPIEVRKESGNPYPGIMPPRMPYKGRN